MRRSIKFLLFIFLGILFLIFLFVLFFSISSYISKNKLEKELRDISKMCDSTQIINEQPEIYFSGFDEKDINILKFEIKRGESIFSDTILKNKFSYVSDDKMYKKLNIPFLEFLKTDTIIITTKNNLKFYVSNFHHGASLHYGMFGPVGVSDCQLSNEFNINGDNGNCISKDISFLESERNNRIRIIGATDEEIETISKKSKVTKAMAEKIFESKRMNKKWLSQIFCGIHIERTGNYYVFAEEREDRNGKKDIIKINAENGNFKRYSNYPFY